MIIVDSHLDLAWSGLNWDRDLTKSVEEIRRFIEADSLAYLSLEGLLDCCDGVEHNGYCTACYTGNYPTQWVDVEEILPATVSL